MPKQWLLVDAAVLPEVFEKAVAAQRLQSAGMTAGEAARAAGLSRSAYYKYKDAVFPYDAEGGRTLTVELRLHDAPGVLSAVLSAFADAGANILTVHQSPPVAGLAAVTIAARVGFLKLPPEDFLAQLSRMPGVTKLEEKS
ncbi:MAG: ACT domain-containing protein [Oscillospiraceae bacterium]|nr:ACT domain-containing protein [Oscillospiraceae bacterium]